MSSSDTPEYQQRKAFFDQMLTVYGRKPVLEALQDAGLPAFKLHLADSNRSEGIIQQIKSLADARNIPIAFHDRRALSRISRNGKQDQGVALDLQLPAYRPYQDLLPLHANTRLIALDRVTNPQNLGMIIRSVSASGITGLLLPQNGCASLSALVIKASAGTLFKAPIYFCDQLDSCLRDLRDAGSEIYGLSSHATQSVFEAGKAGPALYLLGNETEGLSDSLGRLCSSQLCIPMHNGVESLNVAVTAGIIAFTAQSRSS
ncbi:MAG: 23S rRNA (guanosine2251-2'-O)-methyltransferase [Paracoccaceae bacterium]